MTALIDRGLRRYGKGDLDGALGEWELALALDPEAKTAEEYITYVRENFDQLTASFKAEQEQVERVRAEGIPIPDDANDEEYPEIEMSDGANGPGGRMSHEMEAVTIDEGWELDEISGERRPKLAPAAAEPSTPGSARVTVMPRRPSSEVPLEDSLLAGGATADDFEYTDLPDPEANTGRRSVTPGESAAQTAPDQPFADLGPIDLPPLGAGESSAEVGEDAATAAEIEAMEPPLEDDQDYSLEFQDEFSRQSTGASGASQAPSDLADTVRPGSTRPSASPAGGGSTGSPEREAGGPPLDESVLRAYDDVVEFVQPGGSRKPRPDTEAETPAAIKSSLPKPERLATLFAALRDDADRGDYLAAVQTAETLLLEDPQLESFDPREKEVLMRVFEAHLGRMDQVPLVSVPMHEISAANLDHRTGFLLSRIDGMLTYEDILDVAGMPRFEAYRILSSLLRRGFIEVR